MPKKTPRTISGQSDPDPLAYLAGLTPPPHPFRPFRLARVLSVHDGDTIRVELSLGRGGVSRGPDGRGEMLRLWGLDTPELYGPERPEGRRVRDLLAEILPPGQEIVVETLGDREDNFGRLLVILWLPGAARSLNLDLLSQGLAEPFLPD